MKNKKNNNALNDSKKIETKNKLKDNSSNDNITNAAIEIASRIIEPIRTKKFAFLFGSGINNNIAKTKHLNWDNFSKKIIFEFLDSSKNEKFKNRSKWEKNVLSKQINKEINDNIVSCSFLDKKTKLEINSKSKKDNFWFKKGFDLIEERFPYGIIVTTLNYDKVLSQNLKERKVINFVRERELSTNPEKEILHLHGLVDKENYIREEKGILTLKDYATYSSKVKENFLNLLLGNIKKNDDNLKSKLDFTLLIIGASLKEQHLLNAIHKFGEERRNNIKIFLIVHKNWNDFIFKKYKEIYEKINIEVININSGKWKNGNGYEKDFKLFWEKLTFEIQKKDFNYEKTTLEKNNIFSDNDLYENLKNNFKDQKGQKSVSIDQMLDYINIDFKLKNLLIKPIFWLEKKDEIVKKGTLKKYILRLDNSNQFDQIPINKIDWIEDEEFSKKEKNLILKEIEKFLKNKNDSLDYEIERFLLKIYNEDKKIDLEKYKNIHKFLINKISKNELEEKFKKYVLEKTYFSENLTEDSILLKLIFCFYKDYFKSGNFISKIIENTLLKDKLEDKDWFKLKIPKSLEDVFQITQEWRKFHKKTLLFYFFSIEEYNKIIFKDLNSSLNILIKNLNKKNKNDNRLFFILLCSVFLNSKNKENKEKNFIESLKKSKEINDYFESFPNSIEYLSFFTTGMVPFSKYDGTLINKSLISFEKILEYLKKGIEQKAISKFLNKELNDFSKKHRNMKWLIEINKIKSSIFFFIEININTRDWKTYLEYLEKIKKEKIELERLYINPPYQITQRLEYLLDEFDIKNDKKIFDEILIITKIRFFFDYYSTYFIFFNREIKTLLKQTRKKDWDSNLKEKTEELLKQIFSKQFVWLNNINYEKYLEKIKNPKKLEEILFIYSFSKSKKLSHEIDFLIELMKEDSKGGNLLKQRIIFDYFLRILKFNILNSQKIDYFVTLINEIKNINNEEKSYWKKHLKSLLIYYQLFESWEIKNEEWNKIKIFTSDTIRALSYYQVNPKNNLFKIKDQKIANYLKKEELYDNKFLKIYFEIINLKENIQYLGPKTLKIFNNIFNYYEENDKENDKYLKRSKKLIPT